MEKNNIQKWFDLYQKAIELETNSEITTKYTEIFNDIDEKIAIVSKEYNHKMEPVKEYNKQISMFMSLESAINIAKDRLNENVTYDDLDKAKIDFINTFDNQIQFPSVDYNDKYFNLIFEECGKEECELEKKRIENAKAENDLIVSSEDYKSVLEKIDLIGQEIKSSEEKIQNIKKIRYIKNKDLELFKDQPYTPKLPSKVIKLFFWLIAISSITFMTFLAFLLLIFIFRIFISNHPILLAILKVMTILSGVVFLFSQVVAIVSAEITGIVCLSWRNQHYAKQNEEKEIYIQKECKKIQYTLIHFIRKEFNLLLKENKEKQEIIYNKKQVIETPLNIKYDQEIGRLNKEKNLASIQYSYKLNEEKNKLLLLVPEDVKEIFYNVDKNIRSRRQDFIFEAKLATNIKEILEAYYHQKKIEDEERFQMEKIKILERQIDVVKATQLEQKVILEKDKIEK